MLAGLLCLASYHQDYSETSFIHSAKMMKWAQSLVLMSANSPCSWRLWATASKTRENIKSRCYIVHGVEVPRFVSLPLICSLKNISAFTGPHRLDQEARDWKIHVDGEKATLLPQSLESLWFVAPGLHLPKLGAVWLLSGTTPPRLHLSLPVASCSHLPLLSPSELIWDAFPFSSKRNK